MARKFGGTVKKTDTVLVTSVDLASADVTGVLPVANGGTGSGSYTDGQLLIGNTASGNTLTKATLTAGSGISITNGGGSITIASSGGGLTNWSESAGTYSSKDWKRFYPVSGTNVNVVFSPLGTGSIQAHVADGTSAGGNQRGDFAVDWQTKRNAAAQVASGTYSGVLSGQKNTNSGSSAVVSGGSTNSNTADNSVIAGGINGSNTGTGGVVGGGSGNSNAGAFGVNGGGFGNAVTGDYSCIPGGYRGVTRSVIGTFAFASGRFATSGDAQWSIHVLRRSSTSATPVVLTSNSGAASTTNQIILPNNSCFMIRGMSACLRTDVAGDRAEYEWSCGIYRGANAASTVIDYSNVDVRYEGDATFDFTLAADTTNGGLKISFVGASGKTVRAVTTAWCCEVTA